MSMLFAKNLKKLRIEKGLSQRSYFTLRSNISHAVRRISRTKCISQIPQGIYFAKRDNVLRTTHLK